MLSGGYWWRRFEAGVAQGFSCAIPAGQVIDLATRNGGVQSVRQIDVGFQRLERGIGVVVSVLREMYAVAKRGKAELLDRRRARVAVLDHAARY